MDVIVDGKPQAAGASATAFETVTRIGRDLRAEGRAIVDICVDGERIGPEDLETRLGDKAAAAPGSITIASEALNTLTRGAISSLRDVLPELPKACRTLAAIFQGESPESGFESFSHVFDIWSQIKQRQQEIASALGASPDTIYMDGGAVADINEDLNRAVVDAYEALKAKDWVLLGDHLEYELAPRAEREQAIVNRLAQLADAPADSPACGVR